MFCYTFQKCITVGGTTSGCFRETLFMCERRCASVNTGEFWLLTSQVAHVFFPFLKTPFPLGIDMHSLLPSSSLSTHFSPWCECFYWQVACRHFKTQALDHSGHYPSQDAWQKHVNAYNCPLAISITHQWPSSQNMVLYSLYLTLKITIVKRRFTIFKIVNAKTKKKNKDYFLYRVSGK